MTERLRSQKGFVAVTLITVLAIALVLIAYATLLGTFTGGEVVYVENLTAEVLYSRGNLTDTSNWTDTLNITSVGAWYACLNITTANGYKGSVKVTFQLQQKDGSWGNVVGASTEATITLNGTLGERVFVSSNGSIKTNRNWQSDCTPGHSYHVVATVESTG